MLLLLNVRNSFSNDSMQIPFKEFADTIMQQLESKKAIDYKAVNHALADQYSLSKLDESQHFRRLPLLEAISENSIIFSDTDVSALVAILRMFIDHKIQEEEHDIARKFIMLALSKLAMSASEYKSEALQLNAIYLALLRLESNKDEAASLCSTMKQAYLNQENREAEVVFFATPTYPGVYLRKGISGTVNFEFSINECGEVSEIKLVEPSSGKGMFETRGREAFERSIYLPAIKDGKLVKQTNLTMTLAFEIGGPDGNINLERKDSSIDPRGMLGRGLTPIISPPPDR